MSYILIPPNNYAQKSQTWLKHSVCHHVGISTVSVCCLPPPLSNGDSSQWTEECGFAPSDVSAQLHVTNVFFPSSSWKHRWDLAMYQRALCEDIVLVAHFSQVSPNNLLSTHKKGKLIQLRTKLFLFCFCLFSVFVFKRSKMPTVV